MTATAKTIVTWAVWSLVAILGALAVIIGFAHADSVSSGVGSFLLAPFPSWVAYDVAHLLPLAVFVGILSMLLIGFFKSRSLLAKGVCVLGIILLCVFLGPSALNGLKNRFGSWASTRQASQVTIDQINCGGKRTTYTVWTSRVQINPNGDCSADLFYDETVVTLWAWRPNDSKKYGPYHKYDAMPKDTEWISSDTKLTLQVKLVPPRYN